MPHESNQTRSQSEQPHSITRELRHQSQMKQDSQSFSLTYHSFIIHPPFIRHSSIPQNALINGVEQNNLRRTHWLFSKRPDQGTSQNIDFATKFRNKWRRPSQPRSRFQRLSMSCRNDGNRTPIPQNDTRPKGSRDKLFILKTTIKSSQDPVQTRASRSPSWTSGPSWTKSGYIPRTSIPQQNSAANKNVHPNQCQCLPLERWQSQEKGHRLRPRPRPPDPQTPDPQTQTQTQTQTQRQTQTQTRWRECVTHDEDVSVEVYFDG
jgi:hypothetical protein